MKGRPKQYSKRKPYWYCRKKGGAAFRFKGGSEFPIATSDYYEKASLPSGLLDLLLSKLGFRVGAR